ncbi:MAG TPA: hypothetical protein VK854_08710 [Woeseiaceae bacterium]|nr:hypothetical protein [Woeseiaceae bacterium]
MHRFVPALLLLLAGCSPPDAPDAMSIETLAVPAGVDAAGPRVSGGAGRPLVLSWMEPDATGTTLRYSTFRDGGWAPPQNVVSGKTMFVNWADMPSVTALADDHWAAHWLEMAGPLTYSYHVVMAQSFDAGRTWSAPVKPHTDGTPTEHGFVSVYPHDGKVAAIWLDGRKTGGEHGGEPQATGMTLRSATIDADNELHNEQEIDGLICDCCQTDVAISAEGPVAVYRDRTVDEIRDIYVARHVDGGWQPGVALHDDNWRIAGCPVNGPAVDARGSAVAAAWYSVADQSPVVQLRFSQDGAATFGAPLKLADDGALGHVDTVMLEDGSAVVSWLQAAAGGRGKLVLRRVTPGGEMGPVFDVASDAPARSVPQMAVAGNHLVLVWTDAREDGKRIASARIPILSVPSE